MSSQGQHIRLNIARDHLRQHYAIDAGLDTMDSRPLGSDPRSVQPHVRDQCREEMRRCQERAHEELAGFIGGSKITVWRETDQGNLEVAGPGWAKRAFDGEDGLRADKLYFLVSEWEGLLAQIASDKARAFLVVPHASKLLTDDIINTTTDYPNLDGRSYDWPIWKAVEYIRSIIDDDDEHGCFLRTQIALRQAALDERITIFGKAELPPPKPAGHPSEIWTRIKPEYWEDHKFSHLITNDYWFGHDHTMRDPYSTYGFKERYWSLLVNKEQVEQTWPPEWNRWKNLLGHWNQAAKREFDHQRDLANSKASLAGHFLSSAHIRMLLEAALSPVLDLLDRARTMNAPESIYGSLRDGAISCLEQFQQEVSSIITNPSGRYRVDGRIREYFDSLTNEHKQRINDAIAEWLAEDSCRQPDLAAPLVQHSKTDQVKFSSPEPGWLQLWQGPLKFRATYDRGMFGPGHTIERMHQFADEGASGNGRHEPLYSVRIDELDGAIIIEWLAKRGEDGRTQKVSYYDVLLTALHDRIRNDANARNELFRSFWILPDQYARAVGAYATAASLQEWLKSEFYSAIHEGQCEIWARAGSKVAPFTKVPADIFRAYTIKSWGFGQPGAAWAELEGEATLYSIHVAAYESDSSQLVMADSSIEVLRTGDPGRPAKGYNLYCEEHERRCGASEALETLADEAAYLAGWYRKKYPKADPASKGTIENRIRERHRRYKSERATKLS
ncbi:hypothetical protein OOT33_05790 [Sphingobium sp. DEHP117]|uniref:hypothetical protein n=1 Tax=Sphingobium sp. DEHP117 TaxID=2993436 RepID=UPI0027D54974|nr:hypothetical protein [Sphingobium sp. DEHP117]MDQ4419951.1 hypothetical protein [Sphingobium sp. DEHP117]